MIFPGFGITGKYSILLNCPKNVLELKTKQLIYKNFNHKKGKFIFKKSIINICISFFFHIGILLFILILGKKKFTKKSYDLIIDDVQDIEQAYRFKKLLKMFNNTIIFYDQSSLDKQLKKLSPSARSNKFLRSDNSFLRGKFLKFIFVLNKILILSIKNNFNFIYFSNRILIAYIKNNNLFTEYKAKFLVHDRFYRTCPIKNFLFKKNGGTFSACIQSHIPELSMSFYVDIDILFTFGNENYTKKRFLYLGGNVKKTIPVGSHKMESMWHDNTDDLKLIPNIDILIIGINVTTFLEINNKTKENYYTFIKWMKEISLKHPNYNIIYKHHWNFQGDDIESSILRDSNIQTIIRSKKNNSYAYLNKSKIIVSFGSTMILEGLSDNKKCFYIDPNLESSTFFKNIDNLKEIRIKNYKELENLVHKTIGGENNNKNYISDFICLESKNVSKKICNFFKENSQHNL